MAAEHVENNFGKHYLIELVNCSTELIKRVADVQEIFHKSAVKARATILKEYYHQFEPEGVSGVILIAESHFTIHTWPEASYAAIDIFSCGETMIAEHAIEYMQTAFQGEAQVTQLQRGY